MGRGEGDSAAASARQVLHTCDTCESVYLQPFAELHQKKDVLSVHTLCVAPQHIFGNHGTDSGPSLTHSGLPVFFINTIDCLLKDC